MKKILLSFLLIVVCLSSTAQTYDTMRYRDGRCPRYYYSSWYDTTGCYFYVDTLGDGRVDKQGLEVFRAPQQGGWNYYEYHVTPDSTVLRRIHSPYLAKPEYVPGPSLLAGVAVLVTDSNCGWCYDCSTPLNTTLAPDTCYVFSYDRVADTATILAAARYDTATPKIWKIPMNADTLNGGLFRYLRVFEVMFPTPVPVDSLYYIVGTSNSLQRVNIPYPAWVNQPQHYATISRYTARNVGRCEPTPTYRPISCMVYSDSEIPAINVQDSGSAAHWPIYGMFMPIMAGSASPVYLSVVTSDRGKGTTTPSGTHWVRQWYFQTIQAYPKTGYMFSHWSDSSPENPRRVQVTHPMSFVAYFTRSQHTITTEVPDKEGHVTGDGIYYYGDTAVLNAIPEVGFAFSHWHDGVTDNPRRIRVTKDSVFIAYFMEDTTDTVAIATIDAPDNFFTLSPNPATGKVTVMIGITGEAAYIGNGGMAITVNDAAGREVLIKTLPTMETSVELDISALPSGTYFVTLTTPTASGTRRLVVY